MRDNAFSTSYSSTVTRLSFVCPFLGDACIRHLSDACTARSGDPSRFVVLPYHSTACFETRSWYQSKTMSRQHHRFGSQHIQNPAITNDISSSRRSATTHHEIRHCHCPGGVVLSSDLGWGSKDTCRGHPPCLRIRLLDDHPRDGLRLDMVLPETRWRPDHQYHLWSRW